MLAELDQNVGSIVDSEMTPVFDQVPDVVVREMEVTTQQKLRCVPQCGLKLRDLPPVDLGLELVRVVRVGRRHDMGNAIRSRHLTHGYRRLKRASSVIYTRERMAMDVNHRGLKAWVSMSRLQPTIAELPL